MNKKSRNEMPGIPPKQKKNILLVEDEALIALLEKNDLEAEGFDVIHAFSGEEAIGIVSRDGGSIDLVLMDIDLGCGIDGTEAARIILEERDIPVIFLSSHSEREIVKKTEEITSYGYVVKNAGIAVLAASIRMAFRLYEANKKVSIKNMEVVRASSRLMELNSELLESRNAIIEREKRLKLSEALYRAIVENTHVSIYIYQDGKLIYVNNLFCEISGYNREELAGVTISDLLHPADRDRILDYARRRANGEDVPRSYEGLVRLKNGESRLFRFTAVKIELDGRHAVLGAAMDITEHREAEKQKEVALAALRESEQKYRRIFDSFIDIYYRVDTEGVILELSPSVQTLTGWTPEDLLGTVVTDIYVDPGQRQVFLENIYRDGSINGFEILLRAKDGRHIPMSIHARVILDSTGEPMAIEGTLRDISEKKDTEALLRQTAEKYRVLIDNSVDMIWTMDINGCMTFASLAWETVLGYDVETVLGRHFSVFVHPDDVSVLESQIAAGVMARISTRSTPYRVLCYDGSYRWYEANGIAVFNGAGDFEYIVGISRDIHDKKVTEDQLMAAKEAADSANRAKSEFLANMSHEIRTPLSGVIGFTELLLATDLDPARKDYAEKAVLSARSLLDLVNDILDFSKIEAGRLELDEIETDLRALLEKTGDMMLVEADSKGIGFRLVISDNMPGSVTVDPVRLRQVLYNLAANAVKFTERGEVRIMAGFEPIGDTEGRVSISVSDTGIGISSDQARRIFSAFTQGDASTTRKYGGTGLGLVISRRLLERMGSSLRLESEPGKGSKFSFELNLKYTNGPKQHSAGSMDTVMDRLHLEEDIPGRYRILIAEDNEINLELQKALIKIILPQAVLIEARDGLETVRLFSRYNPDLIIMDIQMPLMDGYQVAQEIRKLEKFSGMHVPLIAMTAGVVKGERDRCLQSGMDDYIAKPVDNAKLRFLLAKYLVNLPEDEPLCDSPCCGDEPRFDINMLMSRLGGDSELLDNIISATFRYFGGYLNDLKEAVSAKDYKRSSRLIHMIRGAALNACFNRIALLAKELEDSDNRDYAKMRGIVTSMEEEYEYIRGELSSRSPSPGSITDRVN